MFPVFCRSRVRLPAKTAVESRSTPANSGDRAATLSPMTDVETLEEPLPPVAHATIVYLGPVAPHWEIRGHFGDEKFIDDFRTRVNARLLLLPRHDPQFRRNRERVIRDAERELIRLDWDLGDEPSSSSQQIVAPAEAAPVEEAPAEEVAVPEEAVTEEVAAAEEVAVEEAVTEEVAAEETGTEDVAEPADGAEAAD